MAPWGLNAMASSYVSFFLVAVSPQHLPMRRKNGKTVGKTGGLLQRLLAASSWQTAVTRFKKEKEKETKTKEE